MSDKQEKIRDWMTAELDRMGHGSKGKLAKHLGLGPDAITRMMNAAPGKEARKITANELLLMIEFFDSSPLTPSEPETEDIEHLPVRGEVQAGIWLETDSGWMDWDESIEVVPSKSYPAKHQFALRVRGDSMDEVFEEGDYAICVDFAAIGRDPLPEEIVVAQKWRHGLVEVTLKRFTIENTGSIVLKPESKSNNHEPIRLDDTKPDEEVYVVALVTGLHRKMRRF